MPTACSYLGRENSVDLIRDSFASVLEHRGYHLEVGASGLSGPHLYQYRRDTAAVTLRVDDTAGEKWEAHITVEVDAFTGEVEAIVTEAVTRLLADLSTRLIESVSDGSCRSSVARELSRVIAALE
ncbi:MAG TPA: hypothetical protein QGG47_15070 [Acidobacteriota bacterium]|mgnify:CR=1 FL=1|jgi:hypothetical protein|nr:hypothetical protein [Acidobacteriota bacterium]